MLANVNHVPQEQTFCYQPEVTLDVLHVVLVSFLLEEKTVSLALQELILPLQDQKVATNVHVDMEPIPHNQDVTFVLPVNTAH